MKCPECKGQMNPVKDIIEEDSVDFEAYKCEKCGEELVNGSQLKLLAEKYRALRRAKDITFTKWGNSLAVRIPSDIATELGIKEGTHGLIKKEKQGISIIPA